MHVRSRVLIPSLLSFGAAALMLTGLSGHATAGPSDSPYDQLHGAPEHFHFGKGERPLRGAGGANSTVLMTSHGGPILATSKTLAIFWGSEWSSAAFAGDKISGMDAFFSGFAGSSLAATGTEYGDANGFVTTDSTYLGHTLDTSAAPKHAPNTAAAVAEVCKVTANAPDPNAVYFLFTSTKAGQVNYCAWHSWGSCSNGKRVQVAYMPNIDGIAGCDPQDTTTGHSQGLAAVANVTSHELMEAITDPRGTAWFDSAGYENGDKCAWSFAPVVTTLSNGSQWKLQMEWSNAAYTAGTGLPNRSGQKGCIY